MNRRGFLKFMAAAAAGAATEQLIPNGRVWFIPQKVELYTIEKYADYVNFSDLCISGTTLDPALENIQKELAYRLGLTVQMMMKNHQDAGGYLDGIETFKIQEERQWED